MKTNRRALAIALLSAPCLLACSEDTPPPQPARFDRPNAVAFACVEDDRAVQLRDCRGDIAGNSVAMYALVTQSARGEIASVNLETGRVVDNRRDIPGFTFVPVGEMPVAVVVPPQHPDLTYVADYGSRDIRVLQTNALVAPLSMDPTVDVVRVALNAQGEPEVLRPLLPMEDEDSDEPAAAGELDVLAPTDMVLTPDESALVAAAPDAGVLIYLPLRRCSASDEACVEGEIDHDAVRIVPLTLSRDRLRASPTAQPAASDYAKLCGFEREQPAPAELPEVSDDVLMTQPRPTALALDTDCPEGTGCAPRLLVADEALPILHALDLDALAAGADDATAVQEPLFTGTPTRGVAVTPWVPATLEDGGEAQYVYAIDATDGSVLVLQDGQVLSVNANAIGRTDRVAFNTSAAATAITVVTPEFDPQAGAEQWVERDQCLDPAHPTQNPARLRGVFLATALSDGTLRIVDVHDMELRACRECPQGEAPLAVRHQPRIEVVYPTGQNAEPIDLSPRAANMGFRVGDATFPIRADGTTGSPSAPELGCIACDSDLAQAFPLRSEQDEGAAPAEPDADAGVEEDDALARGCGGKTPALVCAQSDPWASDEVWFATFEGPIPGTTGRIGAFIRPGEPGNVTGALEFVPETDLDFCEAGVLGEDDIAPAFDGVQCDTGAPAASGDQLVVLNPPLSADELRALGADRDLVQRCEALSAALEEENAPPIGFEIRRAYRDRLVLRSHLAHDNYSMLEMTHFEDVASCLESGLLAFDVRGLDQFVVQGVQSGFLHGVIANAAGRCVVAPDADPVHEGRARLGCTYRNPVVQFRIRPPEQQDDLAPLSAFQVQPSTPATKLQMIASSSGFGGVTVVGVQLRWNETDGRLYMVDVHGRGLVPITLDPLPRFAPLSFN